MQNKEFCFNQTVVAMKLTALLLFLWSFSNAQVGINTTDPRATLHVAGDAIIDSLPITTEGYIVVADSINRLRSFCGPNCALKISIDNTGNLWFIREWEWGKVDTLKVNN